ncbi:unnamed protein product [Nezara viridula]|uniref:Potassium channel domain-containing protein n=1 Tax=Nezara viridula TaxID=85310 RepID=A0A9P0EEB3_NEZVI|nr:unnamed protein product [Nezara viridula]
MGYAALGIPLVLLYLSSVGSLLSSCARNIFTRSLCCCLCSNCGYCCYDEKRMQEKERRMRKKRERREYEQRMQGLRTGQEPFYVRSASAYTTSTTNNLLSPLEENKVQTRSTSVLDAECLSNDTSFVDSKSSGNFLAPLLLCFIVMIIYIGGGAFILFKLEESWSYFESIFFCFMVLSTIGFGDSVTNDTTFPGRVQYKTPTEEVTVWFCSIYILCGLALTSMCFNVVHEEIVQRLKSHYIIVNNLTGSKENSVNSFKMTTTATFTEEPSSNEYLSS